MKYIKLSIVFLLIAGLLSCASEPKTKVEEADKPLNISISNSNWVWEADRFKFKANIDEEFTYYGHVRKTVGKKIYNYYVWSNDITSTTVYIIDWKHTAWEFPSGVDPISPNPNQADFLLDYQPNDYSIWKGIAKTSYNVITDMGVKIPDCKVAMNKAYINPNNRSEIVFIVYFEPWDCNHEGFKQIIQGWDETIEVE
jgi:hypothetical protein